VLARVVVPIPHAGSPGALSLVAFAATFVAFIALAWRRPAWALGAYLVLEPFELARAIGPTTLSLPKAALVGIIAGLLLRRAPLRLLHVPALRPLLGGALAIVIVTAATLLPATFVDPVFRETLKAIEYLALLVVGIVAFDAEPDECAIWRALGASVAIVSALAIVQEFTVAPSGFFVGSRIVARIAGPLDGPNQLAGWLAVAVPALAARALLGPRAPGYAALALLGLVTDALTFSRAGAIGVLAGLALVGVLAIRSGGSKRVRRAALGLALPIAVAAVPLALAKNSIASGGLTGAALRLSGADETNAENGLATRGVLWHAALRMFARDPGLGVGAGNFEFLTPTVGLVGVRTHANSLYLQSLAEGGIALFGAVVWTLAAALALLLRAPRTPLAIGVAAGTLALATHQLFDTLVFFPKVGDLWWLLLGIGAASALAPVKPAA